MFLRTVRTIPYRLSCFGERISAGLNALFSGSIDLVPGERLVYDKTNKNLLKDLVDVNLYASWINGYLIFDNIPITEVAKKLERYYNKKILTQNGLGKYYFFRKARFERGP